MIDEAWCIGCTLCIKACPVDCIVGAHQAHAHRDRAELCTGCELCVPACPVDCIAMVAVDASDRAATGWAAWSPAQAERRAQRYRRPPPLAVRAPRREHDERLAAKAAAKLADLAAASDAAPTRRRSNASARVIEAAMARAGRAAKALSHRHDADA